MRQLTIKHSIKKYLVAHSYTLEKDDMVVDALPKVEAMIEIRRQKDAELEAAANVIPL